jgi:hypothetical protein
MKSSVKGLARKTGSTVEPVAPEGETRKKPERTEPSYRTAQTRSDTRQVSGHFKPEVGRTLRLIAVEQDRDVQEMLAEALNMLFTRYGKATRAEVTSRRRRMPTT